MFQPICGGDLMFFYEIFYSISIVNYQNPDKTPSQCEFKGISSGYLRHMVNKVKYERHSVHVLKKVLFFLPQRRFKM